MRLGIDTMVALRDEGLTKRGLLAGAREYWDVAGGEVLSAVQAAGSAGFAGTGNPAGVEPLRLQFGQRQPSNPIGGTNRRRRAHVAHAVEEMRTGSAEWRVVGGGLALAEEMRGAMMPTMAGGGVVAGVVKIITHRRRCFSPRSARDIIALIIESSAFEQ